MKRVIKFFSILLISIIGSISVYATSVLPIGSQMEDDSGGGVGSNGCVYSVSNLMYGNPGASGYSILDHSKASGNFIVSIKVTPNYSYQIKVKTFTKNNVTFVTGSNSTSESWEGGSTNKDDVYIWYSGDIDVPNKPIAKWTKCPKKVDLIVNYHDIKNTGDISNYYVTGTGNNHIIGLAINSTNGMSNLTYDSLSETTPPGGSSGDDSEDFDDDLQEQIQQETDRVENETKINICSEDKHYSIIGTQSSAIQYSFYRGEETNNFYLKRSNNEDLEMVYDQAGSYGTLRIDQGEGTRNDMCYNYLYVSSSQYLLGDDCCINIGTEKHMANYEISGKDNKAVCNDASKATCGVTTTTKASTTTTKKVIESMAEMLDICESSGPLQIIYVMINIFALACYMVPLLLIIMLSIDISKVVTDPNEVKKVVSIGKKRILIGLLLVFTPTLVNILISSLGGDSDLNRCYDHANLAYIQERKEYEQAYFREAFEKMPTAPTTTTTVGEPLHLSKSGEWIDNKEAGECRFGFYLYVPEDAKTNSPLVIILPGDNRYSDYPNINFSSQFIEQYFVDNYGPGKSFNYSDAFILIPKIDYTNYSQVTVMIHDFIIGNINLIDNKSTTELKINRDRVSLVGFSTGASMMFDYTNTYKNYISAMLVVSNGGGASAVNSNLDYYKKMPMKGAAEGQGNQTYASNTKAIFDTLGKSSHYILATDYTHDKMHEYIFSKDIDRDNYNDYIEWLIGQNKGGGGSGGTPYTTTSDELWWPIGSSETTKSGNALFAYKNPVYSSITLDFSIKDRVHSFHDAIDIGANMGTYLIAIGDGEIVEGNDSHQDHGPIQYELLQCSDPSRIEYYRNANSIKIKLDNGLVVGYGHIKNDSIPKELKNGHTAIAGTRVKKGQVIAQLGNTGCSSGPHVHFSTYLGGSAKDPKTYVSISKPRPGLSS